MKHTKFLRAASAALMIVIVIALVLAPGVWAQSKYKTLYKFKGGKDGVYPTGRLIFDQAGKSLRHDVERRRSWLGHSVRASPRPRRKLDREGAPPFHRRQRRLQSLQC